MFVFESVHEHVYSYVPLDADLFESGIFEIGKPYISIS